MPSAYLAAAPTAGTGDVTVALVILAVIAAVLLVAAVVERDGRKPLRGPARSLNAAGERLPGVGPGGSTPGRRTSTGTDAP